MLTGYAENPRILRCGGIRRGTATHHADVGGLVEGEGGRRAGRGDGEEVRAVYVVEIDGGAGVGCYGRDLDVAHLQAVDVAEVEAVRRQRAKHSRLGVGVFALGNLDLGLIGSASTNALDVNI